MDDQKAQHPINPRRLIEPESAHRLLWASFFVFGGSCLLALALTTRISSRLEERDQVPVSVSPRPAVSASGDFEYLWYEAENMRGISETSQYEPLLNPSYLDLPSRSEERRVGKECRSRWWRMNEKKDTSTIGKKL